MPILIVVAHPDDEVLGCGGTVATLVSHGITVRSCILSGEVGARQQRPVLQELASDITSAQTLLGLEEPILGDFPNIKFNTTPHLDLVLFIEEAIQQTSADYVFTHHPNDLNNDHLQTSLACQAAVRLFQRKAEVTPLRGLFYMEILSSTDWAFPGSGSSFTPDTFFEIGQASLEKKIGALMCYQGVMRDFPHPRSSEIVRSLAAYRGGQAGMKYAEAFQTAFKTLSVQDFGG